MTQLISIKDTRDKFGEPKAVIVPIQNIKKDTSWIKESSGD